MLAVEVAVDQVTPDSSLRAGDTGADAREHVVEQHVVLMALLDAGAMGHDGGWLVQPGGRLAIDGPFGDSDRRHHHHCGIRGAGAGEFIVLAARVTCCLGWSAVFAEAIVVVVVLWRVWW